MCVCVYMCVSKVLTPLVSSDRNSYFFTSLFITFLMLPLSNKHFYSIATFGMTHVIALQAIRTKLSGTNAIVAIF